MQQKIQYKDLGIVEYKEAWDYQEIIFNNMISNKLNTKNTNQNTLETENTLIFCEHPHVYTLGKSGTSNNLLINNDFLKKINATYFKTNRGGDITYHGPGQIVGYPIFDLEGFSLNVKQYIQQLEEVIIKTLSDYKIEAGRMNDATGVWLDKDKVGITRKICAIGVRTSRFITMHGFALNINTDLNYFNNINPCGFTDKGVTSLEKELEKNIELEEVKQKLLQNFKNIFEAEIHLS